MIPQDKTYAIVGASNNEKKFGHKVLRDLKNAGYKVVPINPKEKEILDLKTFSKLSDYPGKIDIVVFVVPPEATEKVLEEAKTLGIKQAWLQPGSENMQAIGYCRKNNMKCIYNSCIMLERRKKVNFTN